MTQEITETIKERLDHNMQDEELQITAQKLLLDLILLADEHEFSKKGLIREIEEGITDEYISTVTWANGESKDLDLERLARTGEVRDKIETQGKKLDEETSKFPEKVVMAELEV